MKRHRAREAGAASACEAGLVTESPPVEVAPAQLAAEPSSAFCRPLRILIVGGSCVSLTLFRGPLIRALVDRGHYVQVTAAEPHQETVAALKGSGVDYFELKLGRTGINPLADLRTLVSLVRLMRRGNFDVVLGYTIKPVVYGLLAARWAGVPHRVGLITGVGYAFTEADDPARRIIRWIAASWYRVALRTAGAVIFQNADDLALFRDKRLINETTKIRVVDGSGVDLDHYAPAPLPAGPNIVFLMVARLLRDKGTVEFAQAGRILKLSHPNARCLLVGPFDKNPAAIAPAEVNEWVRQGWIEYRGAVEDVRPEIAGCHVLVLPSYREGIPRTVLEAMAMGRGIVATDVPGCRETVVDGENGLLVPARDAQALAKAMGRYVQEPSFVGSAAEVSLRMVRERFDVHLVNRDMIEVLESTPRAREAPAADPGRFLASGRATP